MIYREKVLADALRITRNSIQDLRRGFAKSVDPKGWVEELTAHIDKALCAYDAHPAEAATRENGDLVERAAVIADLENWAAAHTRDADEYQAERGLDWKAHMMRHQHSATALRAAVRRIAALSTHQQQGVASELIKRLHELSQMARGHGGYWESQYAFSMEQAANALSRAPQPDTVSITVATLEWWATLAQANPFDLEARITAALMTRGK